MSKLSGVLALLGLVLLLLSLGPWLAAGQAGLSPAAASAEDALPERGRALFLAKGCATCHRHAGLAGLGTDNAAYIGPNLTSYQPDPDFVRRWLRDPGAIRPNTAMPELDLSEDEITALIAFLGRVQPAQPGQ